MTRHANNGMMLSRGGGGGRGGSRCGVSRSVWADAPDGVIDDDGGSGCCILFPDPRGSLANHRIETLYRRLPFRVPIDAEKSTLSHVEEYLRTLEHPSPCVSPRTAEGCCSLGLGRVLQNRAASRCAECGCAAHRAGWTEPPTPCPPATPHTPRLPGRPRRHPPSGGSLSIVLHNPLSVDRPITARCPLHPLLSCRALAAPTLAPWRASWATTRLRWTCRRSCRYADDLTGKTQAKVAGLACAGGLVRVAAAEGRLALRWPPGGGGALQFINRRVPFSHPSPLGEAGSAWDAGPFCEVCSDSLRMVPQRC